MGLKKSRNLIDDCDRVSVVGSEKKTKERNNVGLFGKDHFGPPGLQKRKLKKNEPWVAKTEEGDRWDGKRG